MELTLESNLFKKNTAVNGGALFFSDDSNNDNQKIIAKNNTFSKNSVTEFGGAIYSGSIIFNKNQFNTFENNIISYNTADVMGGGIYSAQTTNIIQFNQSEWYFANNTINLHSNDYTTKPAYLSLNSPFNQKIKLITGDILLLNFTLFDGYDNIIKDVTKYYSSMTLRITLEKKNKDLYDNNIKDYYLQENAKQLINGNI